MTESIETKAGTAKRLYDEAEAGARAARTAQDVLDVAIAAVSTRAVVLLPKLRLDKDAARKFVDHAVAEREAHRQTEKACRAESKKQHAIWQRFK